MSLKSDVNVDPAKFDRKNIDQETLDFNQKLIKIWADGPRWYEVRTSLKSQTLFPTIYIFRPRFPYPNHIPHPYASYSCDSRSAPPHTANSAGTAKRRSRNPSCFRMV
jgi:hypothetical protein